MNFRRYRHEIEFLVLVAALFLIWYLGRSLRIDAQAIQQSLRAFPLFYSGLFYIGLYVLITFFIFFSKDVFWLTGAFIFGPILSAIFICIAESINALILFYLARRFGRRFVEKRVAEKYKHLDEGLARINFFWLFIFRAAPLIPYRFMDLAAGLTKIHLKRYMAAVILGTPFKMFWIQHVLFGVGNNIYKQPYALVEYFLQNRTLFTFGLIYLILVIAVIFKLKHNH